MEKQYVMPIKITIKECIHRQGLYNENKEPMIGIGELRDSIFYSDPLFNEQVELTEEMFTSLLSASADEDVSGFIDMFPRLSLFDQTHRISNRPLLELVSEKEYRTAFIEEIQFVKKIMKLLNSCDSIKDFDKLTVDYINELFVNLYTLQKNEDYSHCFHGPSSRDDYDSNLIISLSTTTKDEAKTKRYKLVFNENTVQIIGGTIDEEVENAFNVFKKEFVEKYYEDMIGRIYDCYFQEMTDCITLSLSDNGVIEFRCPTVLSAMYMMISVSNFNQDVYRQCAHKGCHDYFKVDKTHPQTMCEKHMKSRQARRIKTYWNGVRRDPKKLINKKKEQAYSILQAKTNYEKTKNVDDFIEFWEKLWSADGGLLSENNEDAFKLADLYIENGRYNDAFYFANKLEKVDCFKDTAKDYLSFLKNKINQ